MSKELPSPQVADESKQAEEKLRREEQLFRALAEQSSDIIILVKSRRDYHL